MKKLIMVAAAFSALVASAEITITGVTARQRWPWNSLVDVDFTIGGVAQGEAYYVDVSATAAGGDKKLCATTFVTEPIAAAGENRIVWDLGADYPNFKADDLRVTVTATPFSDATPLYLVVDISGGASAAKWPFHYTTTAPVHTVGVEDPCKTTELWLRRVKAGTVTMGKGNGSSTYGYYPQHTVTLTHDYYLGIFPVTMGQAKNIANLDPASVSYFTNELYAATRPCDAVSPARMRSGDFNTASVPGSESILGRLRGRTGLVFDLPTEWQWEYAIRAGSTADYYPGATRMAKRATTDGRNSTESEGTCYVDRNNPNSWGFYCTFGNIWECCLNQTKTITKDAEYTDPEQASGAFHTNVSLKGVGWTWGYNASSYIGQFGAFARSAANLWNVNPATAGASTSGIGMRVFLKVE